MTGATSPAPLAVGRAIMAVPPFPGAKPHPVVQARSEGGPAPSASPAQLIAALREHRVGGSFWLPESVWSTPDETVSGSGADPVLLLAAIAGKRIRSESEGPFAILSGMEPGSPDAEDRIEDLVDRYLLRDVAYADPFTGDPVDPVALTDSLADWRDLIDANRPLAAAFGFAHWKRDTVEPLLWGGHPIPFRSASRSALDALPPGAAVAVWKARVPPAFLAELERGPWRILEVEDGFIRSAGLGADCVPPLSIVVDDLGVHYDPSRPSRLEEMLARDDTSPADRARAQRLCAWLVREGVSKYGVGGGATVPRLGGSKRHILVVGQVEDDRSVLSGGGDVRSNLELLRRVRRDASDAWIVYRPHPDVEAGHRRGAIPAPAALSLADAIDAESPISGLIAMSDEVHVITSLAGFEALLQGRAVVTHGTPFFAGWGLTRDLAAPVSRRGKSLSIEALAAAVLLRYPRYLDPVTNLPCPAEIVVRRLLSGVQRENIALVQSRRLVGWARRAFAQLVGTR